MLRRSRLIVLVVMSLLVLLAGVSVAQGAVAPAAGWTIESVAAPSNFSAGTDAECLSSLEELQDISSPATCDAYDVIARNAGKEAMNGSPLVMTDRLPAGVVVQKILLESSEHPNLPLVREGYAQCTISTVVSCEIANETLAAMPPDGTLRMSVYVTVGESTPSGPLPANEVEIMGGGAPAVAAGAVNEVSSASPAFGVSAFDFDIDAANGTRDTQAGDHPYELTTTIDLASTRTTNRSAAPYLSSIQDLRDVVVDLPLGFVGSTLVAPQCTLTELASAAKCPEDTRVGRIETEPVAGTNVHSPIWNIVPEHGVPAEFGFADEAKNSHVFYTKVVPTPSGYVLQVSNTDIPQTLLSRIVVTFYGNPAEKDHTGNAEVPFFTNPTGCGAGPLKATLHVDSWQQPGVFNADGTPDLASGNWVSAESVSPPVTGCDELQYLPELMAQPTTTIADSPSGLEFEIKQPQTANVNTPATSELQTANVTFPEGMTVDPSAGNGLAACSEAQIGWEGGTPKNFNLAQPACPEASKVGSLELETPLIRGVLTGEMYLASENENPYGSVFGVYVVVNDPVTGVLIKLAGRLSADPHTGRLTGTFEENPQLPFSDLKLHFFAGPRAELTTPENCGTYTTNSLLEPWSAPGSGPNALPFDSYTIDSGCVTGFTPAFTGGSTNLQAGAYTTFEASFSREDTDQELGGLSVALPPGLLADVGSVPLCGETQANAGTCPENTRVGTVQAEAGPGPNPLAETGRAYLTGSYNGGPYGLSVVVPAIAGPFNFGNVVVRQSLRINPETTQVTDVSDPFPTILDVTGANGQTSGIPIRLRRVDVYIDRPGFTLNPTNCGKLQVSGSITSTQGQSRSLATPFQVTDCQALKFQPKFTVSTSGKASKANGASLSVKLAYPTTTPGVESNITRVKVDLPKQLPSRLTTLQQACTAAQFNLNPASCPLASKIGYATVHTPILAAPLSGPAIFVSHGGEAFPSLIIVLQGDGVTLDLVGTTFISKAGITSSTFKTVPDAPVGSFELTLPTGKYSALAANLPASAHYSFCGKALKMPTEFVAQNGAQINESTPITITGCAKKAKQTKSRKHAKAKHKQKK
jgi:hypothetical protein